MNSTVCLTLAPMSLLSYLAYFAVIALILGAVLAILWQIIRLGRDFFHHYTDYRFLHWYHRRFIKEPLNAERKRILETYFGYYRGLTAENQQLFEYRVRTFIDMKEFIVRTDQLRLTEEMIVLISACAIQLSFGFPGIFFRHFKRILIYPDDYYSTITRQYHQGEVNRGGIIVLSWSNFLKGYADQGDGKNLGLHEMAHAMLLENRIMNGEYEFINPEALRMWDQLAGHELIRIENGDSLFRKYGATNKHELFAVAIEEYFERPNELRNYSSAWYHNMSTLLNQDILKITSGYP